MTGHLPFNDLKTRPAVPVLLAVDASGSMHKMADDVIGGVNQYLDDLSKDNLSTYKVSLCLFDSEVTMAETAGVAPEAMQRLSEENYRPHGATALYDAVGALITSYEQQPGERPLVVVMTDGHENASETWTLTSLKAMIAEKVKQGWGFVYLGAGLDVWEGERLGMWSASTVNTREGTRGMYSGLSMATSAYAAGASAQSVTETAAVESVAAEEAAHDAR